MSSKSTHPWALIPASYGGALISALLERGLAEHLVLQGTGLDRAQLQNGQGRLSLAQYATMVANAGRLGALDGLAYELGLRSAALRHGFVGLGVMGCRSLREAVAFSERYFGARWAWAYIPCMLQEDEEVVVSLRQHHLLPDELRIFTLNMVLVELCSLFTRVGRAASGMDDWACAAWVPYAEPPIYARYRQQLPDFHFNEPAAQIRFPFHLLDRVATGSGNMPPDNFRQPELSGGKMNAFSAQVLGRLVCHGGRYPDAGEIAQWLCISERTMKRRLQDEGGSFQALLNKVRCHDSERMLANPVLSVKQVAQAVGYEYSSNFARAFAGWTGVSPNEWRMQRKVGCEIRPGDHACEITEQGG